MKTPLVLFSPFHSALFLLLLTLSACSSSPPEELPPPQPLTSDPNEPAWVSRPWSVSDEGREGTILYAVGFAPRNPDLSIQLEIARSRARSELARIIGSLVTAITRDIRKTYQSSIGSEQTESADFAVIQSERIAQELLQGSRQVDVWRDSRGGLWVLMKLPLQNLLANYKKSLLTQFEKEKAAEATLKRLQESTDRVLNGLLEKGGTAVRAYLTGSPFGKGKASGSE